MLNYNKILVAHYKTKLPLMLWGSSGFGKTSLVKAYAKKYDFDLQILHAQYLDPLALFIPSTSEMKDLGFVKMYPAEVLHQIFHCNKKTILFLDELTRAREETFNILTELLLERSIFGYRVPASVQIIAASNFSEEDSGVRELPDAVLQRMTHIVHAPEPIETIGFIQNALIKELLIEDTHLISRPSRFPIYDLLRACPRQLDACGTLATQGLQGDELMAVCRGRIGLESGTEVACRLEMKLSSAKKNLPQRLLPEEYHRVARIESQGGVLEVVQFLREQVKNPELHEYLAQYLLEFASPESCRALQIYGFTYQFQGQVRKSNGDFFTQKNYGSELAPNITAAGKPWQWYAARMGKMVTR